MDEKLCETTNLGVEITNSKRQVKRNLGHFGTNLRLPFDVNVMLNFSVVNTIPIKKRTSYLSTGHPVLFPAG